MKYDCTLAKDFFHEITRLKEWCRDKSCGTCEISTCPLGCAPTVYDWGSLSDDVFTNLIGVLQKWSDTHPERRELTGDERIILKAFKALGFNYIAVDDIGYVCVYPDSAKFTNEKSLINTEHRCIIDILCVLNFSPSGCKKIGLHKVL